MQNTLIAIENSFLKCPSSFETPSRVVASWYQLPANISQHSERGGAIIETVIVLGFVLLLVVWPIQQIYDGITNYYWPLTDAYAAMSSTHVWGPIEVRRFEPVQQEYQPPPVSDGMPMPQTETISTLSLNQGALRLERRLFNYNQNVCLMVIESFKANTSNPETPDCSFSSETHWTHRLKSHQTWSPCQNIPDKCAKLIEQRFASASIVPTGPSSICRKHYNVASIARFNSNESDCILIPY